VLSTSLPRRKASPWRILLILFAILALTMSAIVAAAPPRADAAGSCGSPCDNISGDPATLAKQLGTFVADGTFVATANGAGDTNDLYRNEILPIANGNPTPGCALDTRVLQTLVIVHNRFTSLQVNDLNRACPSMAHPVTCASNTQSKHCTDPATAIDFGRIGSSTLDGTDPRSLELLNFLDTFVPTGSDVGQSPCTDSKKNGYQRGWTFTNITKQVPDGCTHQHFDFSSTTAQLSITPSSYSTENAVAVRAVNGALWTWRGAATTPGFARDSNQDIQAGTSPAAAHYGSDDAVAFVGTDGNLWTWSGKAGTVGRAVSTTLGVKTGTSPSIVYFGSGEFAVAFQANTGELWTWHGGAATIGIGRTTGKGMMAGTSPSITTVGSGVSAAFQADTGSLWTWYGAPADTGVGKAAGVGMKAGTSPSITRVNGSTIAVAAQANTGKLWVWNGTPRTSGVAVQTSVGMRAGTSPAIALVGSQLGVAVQASTNVLWTWRGAPGDSGFAYSTGVGLEDGSSPSAAVEGDHLAVAMQANTGSLWTWAGNPGEKGFAAAGGIGISTSPSIG
jgi:hypothetical protein